MQLLPISKYIYFVSKSKVASNIKGCIAPTSARPDKQLPVFNFGTHDPAALFNRRLQLAINDSFLSLMAEQGGGFLELNFGCVWLGGIEEINGDVV